MTIANLSFRAMRPLCLRAHKVVPSLSSANSFHSEALRARDQVSVTVGLSFVQRRYFAAQKKKGSKLVAPPMVYISGEEMTRYACELMLEKWVTPNIDISNWQFYDLSCKNRDATDDQV